MSAQTDDDDLAAFAHQAEQEYRERNACEKCGEPASIMWDDRLLCHGCHEDLTIWEPREGYEEFLDPPEEVPEEEEDGNL